jgi:hypothetical protein
MKRQKHDGRTGAGAGETGGPHEARPGQANDHAQQREVVDQHQGQRRWRHRHIAEGQPGEKVHHPPHQLHRQDGKSGPHARKARHQQRQHDLEQPAHQRQKDGRGKKDAAENRPGVELFEVIRDQWQRDRPSHHPGRQRRDEEPVAPAHEVAPPRRTNVQPGERHILIAEAVEPRPRDGREQHQPEHGDERKLKSGVVEIERVVQQDRHAAEAEQLHAIDRAAVQETHATDRITLLTTGGDGSATAP